MPHRYHSLLPKGQKTAFEGMDTIHGEERTVVVCCKVIVVVLGIFALVQFECKQMQTSELSCQDWPSSHFNLSLQDQYATTTVYPPLRDHDTRGNAGRVGDMVLSHQVHLMLAQWRLLPGVCDPQGPPCPTQHRSPVTVHLSLRLLDTAIPRTSKMCTLAVCLLCE